MAVKFQVCKLFGETFERHQALEPRLRSFLDLKTRDPMAPFGSSDKSFSGTGDFAKAVPKLRHAHLNHDISILYTVGGRDPTLIRLYGLFSHDESGTGQPANINRQKSLSKRLAKQTFDSND